MRAPLPPLQESRLLHHMLWLLTSYRKCDSHFDFRNERLQIINFTIANKYKEQKFVLFKCSSRYHTPQIWYLRGPSL